MEAFKGKVVRLRVWGSVPSAPRTRLPLTIDAIYQGEKGRQNSNSNDILRSFPFYFFEWMAKNGEGKWPTHTLCWCVCFFFQWFSTNAKSNFKWRKNITTCVYGCSSSQLHTFTRLFGQEKSGLPPTKKFGFRGQETVKTPPQIERGRRRPGKTAAKNTPDLGGAKVGLNDLFWPLVPASSRGTSSLIHW